MANAEKILRQGNCPRLSFIVDQHTLLANFLVIPLDGFNMVLGVKWLHRLEPILWDSDALTMSFESDGMKITFHGQQSGLKDHFHSSQETTDSNKT